MRFLADEDFDNRIVRGVLRRLPHVDMVRVQDTRLAGATDTMVLAWAAAEERILLTHDVRTMTVHAAQRIQAGLPMPGVLFVRQSLSVREVIDDLVLIAEYGIEDELRNQMRFLPLT
ncbi:MAG: DUF5615 family PIN-like protein [Anaerolineae bacterium]|nr:DUF5615 family PIN-like protein [Anaerolineae bacterium]MCO5188165.1 DUF5615 family PIN-like protein [Anaerolineae bacterium]MCO5193038.1 DUF5615 family PIN-like protein [Anaerolineae bacterium]MCO5205640.1 DUF5615 family PIN-like protein [Anaerolineae bacterium]